MKKILIFALLGLIIFAPIAAQSKKKDKKKPVQIEEVKKDTVSPYPPLFQELQYESVNATLNLHYMLRGDKKYDPMTVDSLKVASKTKNPYIIFNDLVKRLLEIDVVSQQIFGFEQKYYRFLNKMPIIVANKNNKTCFVVSTIVYDYIFNSLQVRTYKERATKLLESNLIKAISQLSKSVRGEQIDFVGAGIVYAYKSFAEKDALSDCEYFCIITPINVANQLTKGEITIEELVAKSDCYLEDKDNALRKVSIY